MLFRDVRGSPDILQPLNSFRYVILMVTTNVIVWLFSTGFLSLGQMADFISPTYSLCCSSFVPF